MKSTLGSGGQWGPVGGKMKSTIQKIGLSAIVLAGLVLACIKLMPSRAAGEVGSNSLYFGRILIGPDKTDDSKIFHFIVQGRDLYVDENKDNIPQPEELDTVRSLPLIEDPESKTIYEVSGLRLGLAPENVSDKLPQQLGMTVEVQGKQAYTQSGSVVLTRDPEKSNWLHFSGPLEMLFLDDIGLHKGGAKPSQLKLYVGSVARGSASDIANSSDAAGLNLISRTAFLIPDETTPFPRVTIKYAAEGEDAVDGTPIIQELDLDTFC